MKKSLYFLSVLLVLIFCLTGCSKKTELDSKKPVSLTLWHVYGEQADSPMNRLVSEFNQTVGQEKGIIIDVTLMSNAAQIGGKLSDAQSEKPGVPSMPDLFFCHRSDTLALGPENLINWKDLFSNEELDQYIPEFLEDGMNGDALNIFPVSKSTQMLFLCGSVFDRFLANTGVTYDSLSTWDGFFQTAEKYYNWSGGKPFCALDYPIRSVELNALEKGAENIYTDDGWYDFSNPVFRDSWMAFAASLAKGHIVVSDLYSNTQIMTGEVAAGIGSSASILYYNDMVTYPDNSSEPMELQVLPIPKAEGSELLATQAGVGLCAYKTTSQKAEAASVFARWLTESERNLDFCVQTGYFPVNKGSFEEISHYNFPSDAYRNLYNALETVHNTGKMLQEPSFPGYYAKVNALYDDLREMQPSLPRRFQQGEPIDDLTEETWQLLQSVGRR